MPDDVTLLKAKLDEWDTRIRGPDVHSIYDQVGKMLWRSAFYRAVNASRRFLRADEENALAANGTLHELINSGYLTMHALAVRRLLEKGQPQGKRGVNSLAGLIEDIRCSSGLLTRRRMLQARGLVYDYQPLKDRAREEARVEAKAAGAQAYHISTDGWYDSFYWHRAWDKVCGTEEQSRRPNDRPAEAQFEQLLQDLNKEAHDVAECANKYIAHAASADSRGTLSKQQQGVSLETLWSAERTIVRVAGFLAKSFGHGSFPSGVAAPQFDLFNHLDKPFASREAIEVMEEEWEAHNKEIEDCNGWDWSQPL